MNIQEFTDRTGFYPSMELYAVIEQTYMEQSADKDAFCKTYKENADGLAERIQREVNRCRFKADQQHAADLTRRDDEINRLSKELEREQEWKPHGHNSNMTDEDYAQLTQSGKVLTDAETVELIAREFGFAPDKIKIVHRISTYEISRHNCLRKVGEIDRLPVYNATDWNYVCFNCAGWWYEMIDGQLQHYCE